MRDLDDVLALFETPLSELAARADRRRREGVGDSLELCGIVNAKAGRCSEDCTFCAQSARHRTGITEYPLKPVSEMVAAAERAVAAGCARFGIVTSGPTLSVRELDQVCEAVGKIADRTGAAVCASLGELSVQQFSRLREAGLTRYNHNIETSRRYFGRVVTTHAFEDRLRTVRAAAEAGLEVCCGGIIGMGESRADRAAMALTLRDMDVDSVPINILMPIPGTPLAGTEPLGPAEALRTIAVFRILMPDRAVKLAGGRQSGLGDFQGMAFMAGANGLILGDYLTQRGRPVEQDHVLLEAVREAWKT